MSPSLVCLMQANQFDPTQEDQSLLVSCTQDNMDIMFTGWQGQRTDSVATDTEVPGSIPGATRFSE